MRIKTRISQHRRDFTADYECEFCGRIDRSTGYDDAYFHNEVIPAMRGEGAASRAVLSVRFRSSQRGSCCEPVS